MACPDADTLNTLVAGKLDGERRARLVDHAASCPDCHGVLDALLQTTAASSTTIPMTVDRVDRYVIERRIGAGAMGVVYAARDPELERPVAIKLLRGGSSAARLKREAQLLARLEHPNVVAVYDVGQHDGQTFVAMALVDGDNLRTWLATPRSTEDIVRVLCEAGRGVAAAHADGLIHRDLKPDNIFVATDGAVRVGDFGLARLEGDSDAGTAGGAALQLTRSGMVPGTPAYMAPEHAAGEPTAASDQFSFCVTAWEALSGARPFTAPTFGELLTEIRSGELPASPEAARIPARIRAALERGLRADPDARFPSMNELLAALAPRRRRWPWIAAGVAVLAAGAVAVTFAMQHGDPAVACDSTAHELDDLEPGLTGGARDLLGGYVRDWLALRRATCVAPRGEHDPRVACLERAHGVLRTLVAGIGSNADADRIRDAAIALPRLGECETALEGTASRDQVVAGEHLRAKIEEADARGAFVGPGGLDELRGLEAEADRLGYTPAIIDALITQARALARGARMEEAAALLRRALTLAESIHDDRNVAMVVSQLAPIAIGLGRLDEARTIIELGAAALARAGGDQFVEIFLIEARVKLAGASGDHPAAIALALAAIERLKPTREVSRLYVLLANEYMMAGRMAEAAEALQHAHFEAADPLELARQGAAAIAAGEAPRSIEIGQRLTVLASQLGNPSLQVHARMTIARGYEIEANGRMMVDAFQAVVAYLDGTPAVDTPDLRGEALEGLGRGWLKRGEPARAIEPLRASVAQYAKAGAAEDDGRASAAIALGEALVDTGKPHDARVLLEPILHELATATAAPPQRRAGASYQLARALWEDGDRHDRSRAVTLAGDAERDYAAGLERMKGSAPVLLGLVRRRLDDVRSWRQHHRVDASP